jgi:hypothetical protein
MINAMIDASAVLVTLSLAAAAIGWLLRPRPYHDVAGTVRAFTPISMQNSESAPGLLRAASPAPLRRPDLRRPGPAGAVLSALRLARGRWAF